VAPTFRKIHASLRQVVIDLESGTSGMQRGSRDHYFETLRGKYYEAVSTNSPYFCIRGRISSKECSSSVASSVPPTAPTLFMI
jgi:hypothetical protein